MDDSNIGGGDQGQTRPPKDILEAVAQGDTDPLKSTVLVKISEFQERKKKERAAGEGKQKKARPALPEDFAGLGLTLDDAGGVVGHVGNLLSILADHPQWRGKVWSDARTGLMWINRDAPSDRPGVDYRWREDSRPYDEVADPLLIRGWLESRGIEVFKQAVIREAVVEVGRAQQRDLVREYLEKVALPAWRGRKATQGASAAGWLTRWCGAEDTAYVRNVGLKWLVSGVARVMQPGCQVDTTLVLEGEQGVGKTSVFRIMGGAWHGSGLPSIASHYSSQKDARQILLHKWIVEFAELEAIRPGDIESVSKIKEFLTETEDFFRSPYGRGAVGWPRRTVFCGTTNDSRYLVDGTGNRRFWPVRCVGLDRCGGKFDLKGLESHRDLLWGEAVELYQKGVQWWFGEGLWDGEALAALEEIHAERQIGDPLEEQVGEWLEGQPPGVEVTMSRVLRAVGLGDVQHLTTRNDMRIGRILSKLGWSRIRKREGNKLTWVYRKNIGICSR